MNRTDHHLSHMDRATLMLMRGQGYSLRAIGTKLHRAPSTLSRELVRIPAKVALTMQAKPPKGPAQLEPVAAPDAH